MPLDAYLPSPEPPYETIGQVVARIFHQPERLQPPALEEAFIADYSRRHLRPRQVMTVLGFLAWSSFIGIDIWIARQNPALSHEFQKVFLLRGLGAVTQGLTCVLTFSPAFRVDYYANIILSFQGVSIFAIEIFMASLTSQVLNDRAYFVGLYLIMIFSFSLVRMRYTFAIWIDAYFCVSGTIVFVFLWPQFSSRYDIEWPAESFLIFFAVVGFLVVGELERTARGAFLREHQLTELTAYLAEKNTNLELANKRLNAAQADLESRTSALIAVKEASRLRAQQANVMKSKFLADAAHDLRQPLQALSNYLEVAAHAAAVGNSTNSVEMIDQARRALALSRASLGGVLDISSLDSGFIKPAYAHFDVLPVVRDTAAQFTGLAEENGVRLRIAKRDSKPVIVRSDPNLLGRVLINLISNAIKYSSIRQGGNAAVLVGVVAFANRITVDVIDNGIGIPRAQWNNIFSPFVQLGNRAHIEERGAGLGLSIVNAIVQMLDGHRLEMSSVVGKGSRFSIEVPRADDIPLEDAAAASPSPERELADLTGIYVVYVEDDAMVRNSVAAIFNANGILYEKVAEFAELAPCLSAMERMPDIIVSDYRLLDGYHAGDVIHAVRANWDAEIPAIILTAEMAALDHEAWYTPNMTILHKPISSAALLHAISDLIHVSA